MQVSIARVRSRLTSSAHLQIAKQLIADFKHDDITGGAAELAFRLFLALFPFLIFLAALGSFIADTLGLDNPTESILNLLGESLPPDTRSVLRTQIDAVLSARSPELVSFGVFGTIYAASGGVGTIIKVTDRIYEVTERRPFLFRVLLTVTVTLISGLALVAAFLLFVMGQVYGSNLARDIGLGASVDALLTVGQWGLAFVISFTAVLALYWACPNVRIPIRWLLPGALLFVTGWFVATLLFGLYVSRFGTYNTTYGALGGVVITLTFFYLTSLILLGGAEVNAFLARRAGVMLRPKA